MERYQGWLLYVIRDRTPGTPHARGVVATVTRDGDRWKIVAPKCETSEDAGNSWTAAPEELSLTVQVSEVCETFIGQTATVSTPYSGDIWALFNCPRV